VFPAGFWDDVEAFYVKNFGSVADFDMDRFVEGFFSRTATKPRSLLEWKIVLLAIRDFYRLHVWTSTHVSMCSPDCLKPVLEVLCREDQDDCLRIVGFACERKVMDGLRTWMTAWEVARSARVADAFLRDVSGGYLQAARASSYKAEYVGRAALLYARSGDSETASKLFEEALADAEADESVFVALREGRVDGTLSPGNRDAATILGLMKEAGLLVED